LENIGGFRAFGGAERGICGDGGSCPCAGSSVRRGKGVFAGRRGGGVHAGLLSRRLPRGQALWAGRRERGRIVRHDAACMRRRCSAYRRG